MKGSANWIADFDSASSMVYGLAAFLDGRPFPGVGVIPTVPAAVARAVNRLPRGTRDSLYTWSGWLEAMPPSKVHKVRASQVDEWTISQYKGRSHPGVLLGSANGALAHLGAALAMPYLPQTVLLPVRRSLPPDMVREDMEWGRETGRTLAENNPDLLVHQMHDPLQDRLMVSRMAYFRLKHARLSQRLRQHLIDTLPEGAPVILLDCRLRWPVTQVSPRHLFQVGGLGGSSPEEIFRGSPRIAEFLEARGSSLRDLHLPEPDRDAPEAEWGFDSSLEADLAPLARERGWRLRRLGFVEPDDVSPMVADLYRWWYSRLGRPADKLLVECFALVDPWWTLRSGSIPWWLAFNTAPSADALERYLDVWGPFQEMYLMLLSNGVESVAFADSDRWRSIAGRATHKASFLGTDMDRYPADLGSFGRFHAELARQLPLLHPLPQPLTIDDLDAFLAPRAGRYALTWEQIT